MHYDIRLTDRRPKAIVRELLRQNVGPRDYAGRDAMWLRWWAVLDREGYVHSRFVKWMRSQDWTLGEMLSYLEYQVIYLNGDVDEEAFANEWAIVRPIFKQQELLDPTWIAPVESQPAPIAAFGQDLAVLEL